MSERTDANVDDPDVLARARTAAEDRAHGIGRPDLAEDAGLVTSELVTNALLHGGGCTGVDVTATEDGLRIEVRDVSRVPPVLGRPSDESLTGRGLRLVESIAVRWGADIEADGKVVWAEVSGQRHDDVEEVTTEDLLAMWGEEWDAEPAEPRFRVELGDVPTDLLLAAKSHVDNLVREFALASAGALSGMTAEMPPHLASLRTVVERFSEARVAIKHQALEAARRGARTTRLSLHLPASAAEAGLDYLAGLDEVDAYCRAARLLTLETPPQHRLFRHWYIGELVLQLQAAVAGEQPVVAQSFEQRLLAEVDRVAIAQRATERGARLYSVAAALATAATPEAVADAVLNEGVAALRASGGGILLSTDAEQLSLPGAVGYDENVVEQLRRESRDAELPAALALRTGEAVWLESRSERDRRFPELVGLEAGTVALCAVPLEVQGRRLGALRFSFTEARLFDEDERQFVLTLAAQAAEALDRAQLQQVRSDVSRRLQRSLLPRNLPDIPGVEVSAIYHPFGDGMDVGGDFYDVWEIDPNRWAIAIGDATGTGPEAVALSALVRHTLRALTMSGAAPGQVLTALNGALLAAGTDDAGERFCTTIFGVVTTGEFVAVRLANGGHPPPFIRRSDGRVERVEAEGSLLGVLDIAAITDVPVRLDPGDTFVLVTDGILEARRDGDFFGDEGVEQVLQEDIVSAQATAERLEAAVLRHIGGLLVDDMAAVVLHLPAS